MYIHLLFFHSPAAVLVEPDADARGVALGETYIYIYIYII